MSSSLDGGPDPKSPVHPETALVRPAPQLASDVVKCSRDGGGVIPWPVFAPLSDLLVEGFGLCLE